MTTARLFLTATTLASTACLSLLVNHGVAEDPKPARPALDRPKVAIEMPTKLLVARGAAANFVNPKVEPGKVQWQASFAAAGEAARKSGKPVLLFQLLGKLDEQFT